jgi:formylglycine-generating enzyme required for sulfatase activity
VRDFAGDPAVPVPTGDDLPMPLSCQDATAFCARFGYRLPTEAEWERACRGGLQPEQEPWRTEEGMRAAAWFHRNAEMQSHAVRQKQPNAFGLYDMLGNLWEWCDDDFNPVVYQQHGASAVDPRTPGTAGHRVLRGGSWFSTPPAMPHTRKSGGFAERTAFFGCRPACDAPAAR